MGHTVTSKVTGTQLPVGQVNLGGNDGNLASKPGADNVCADDASQGREYRRQKRFRIALLATCEFWAAAMSRTLHVHLGSVAQARLRAAEESFSAIGMQDIATVLRRGRAEVVAGMEEALVHIDDPAAELIAQFACELRKILSRIQSSVVPPPMLHPTPVLPELFTERPKAHRA